nr:lysine-specific demethylase 6B-like [Lepeophtheirus salmonis]
MTVRKNLRLPKINLYGPYPPLPPSLPCPPPPAPPYSPYGRPSPPPPPPAPPANYAYIYSVLDAASGVAHPHGRIKTVTYTVEGDRGFVSDVQYEDAPASSAPSPTAAPAPYPSYVPYSF